MVPRTALLRDLSGKRAGAAGRCAGLRANLCQVGPACAWAGMPCPVADSNASVQCGPTGIGLGRAFDPSSICSIDGGPFICAAEIRAVILVNRTSNFARESIHELCVTTACFSRQQDQLALVPCRLHQVKTAAHCSWRCRQRPAVAGVRWSLRGPAVEACGMSRPPSLPRAPRHPAPWTLAAVHPAPHCQVRPTRPRMAAHGGKQADVPQSSHNLTCGSGPAARATTRDDAGRPSPHSYGSAGVAGRGAAAPPGARPGGPAHPGHGAEGNARCGVRCGVHVGPDLRRPLVR
jgi:hypothetical protein